MIHAHYAIPPQKHLYTYPIGIVPIWLDLTLMALPIHPTPHDCHNHPNEEWIKCMSSLTKALATPPGHTLECHLPHNHLVHLDRSKNKSTMEGQAFKPTLILKKIKSLTTEFFFSLPYQMKRTRYTNTLIGWKPPPLDFFKLQMVWL